MRHFTKDIINWQAQCIVWLVIYILSFLSNRQEDPLGQSALYALIAMFFYASIIYGNAYWLIPRFFYRKKYVTYFALLLLLMAANIVSRAVVGTYIYNALFATKPEPLERRFFYFTAFSSLFILLFSIFFRLALNFFTLSRKQEQIRAEQAQTELNLLKQQVHPHFLFNTLNNIYYVASNESPAAADLIERLSGIMRYFIEESKKDRVLLNNEIELLKSYIELEGIRMRYEMPVGFVVNGNTDGVTVPPLMLLPLAENIFKHGVDKRSMDNFAEISLTVEGTHLTFTTSNMYYAAIPGQQNTKTGLVNLEKRLRLYYGSNYTLTTRQQDGLFMTHLQIPLNEN